MKFQIDVRTNILLNYSSEITESSNARITNFMKVSVSPHATLEDDSLHSFIDRTFEI